MSGGGPPHHPHNRHVPPSNSAWNHLSVPGYFRRQPQAAHMPTDHPLLHQPSWHTPTTTESMKFHPHSMINEMFKSERFARDCVDLSLTRNGQNGEPPPNPGAISLSVRDASKINSLLEIQAVELTKCTSPSMKPTILSPVNARKSVSPGPKAASPGLNLEAGKSQKRSNVRVDSILERLNPDKEVKQDLPPSTTSTSVIVSATSNFDENSNSSGTNIPTPKEDDSASMSNEDSLDSTKSRRKRKPSKTIRVNKEDEVKQDPPENIANILEAGEPAKVALEPAEEEVVKTRRKTSSESETIDNIAAMVQEALKERSEEEVPAKLTPENKEDSPEEPTESVTTNTTFLHKDSPQSEETPPKTEEEVYLPQDSPTDLSHSKPSIEASKIESEQTELSEPQIEVPPVEEVAPSEPVSVLQTNDLDVPPEQPMETLTPAQKKATITQFVEVENKLEEMFAGIVEEPLEDKKEVTDDGFLKLEEGPKKATPKKPLKTKSGDEEVPPAKKKKMTKPMKKIGRSPSTSKKKSLSPVKMLVKNNSTDSTKDVFAYDSGSNASSSKSRGPFVQIRGPRDSPLSVCVVNTPLGDEDAEQKRTLKNKKFHDDSEYRHKVRSKGLHCSTLSNKYDAERRDTSWICAFCKRGPHANDISGPSAVPTAAPPPGDLFGPYIITAQCPEFEKRLDDPYDRQFKSRKIGKVLDSRTSKKTKRKSESVDPTDSMLGITDTGQNTYEVWMHEDCMVWSPGVYLIGPKIVGLEEAVWTCSNIQCMNCGLKGANVTCVKRGCLAAAHLCCARRSTWQLLDDDFKAFCAEHMR